MFCPDRFEDQYLAGQAGFNVLCPVLSGVFYCLNWKSLLALLGNMHQLAIQISLDPNRLDQ